MAHTALQAILKHCTAFLQSYDCICGVWHLELFVKFSAIMRLPFAIIFASYPRKSLGKPAGNIASREDRAFEVCSPSMSPDFLSPQARGNSPTHWRNGPQVWRKLVSILTNGIVSAPMERKRLAKPRNYDPSRIRGFTSIFARFEIHSSMLRKFSFGRTGADQIRLQI